MNADSPTEDAILPLWSRILYGAVVPPGALLGIGAWWYTNTKWFAQFKSTPGWGGTVADVVIPLIVIGVLSFIFVPATLMMICGCVSIPWKHWWSALLGGFAATGIGLALGLLVLAILQVLS